MCGYLSLRACQLSLSGVVTGSGAGPVKRWFSLHSDFVLYTFKSEYDCHALTATPMPGYTILTGQELKGETGVPERDRDKTIKMFYAPLMTSQQSSLSAACRKAYFFTGSAQVEVKRSGQRVCPVCRCSSYPESSFLLRFCMLDPSFQVYLMRFQLTVVLCQPT